MGFKVTNDKGVRVNDPLFAKALVLDDGQTKLAIIAIDATAIGDIDDDFLPKLRGRIEKELGLPGRNVLVNASHIPTAISNTAPRPPTTTKAATKSPNACWPPSGRQFTRKKPGR